MIEDYFFLRYNFLCHVTEKIKINLRVRVSCEVTGRDLRGHREAKMGVKLENIRCGVKLGGIRPSLVTVVSAEWIGDRSIHLVYRMQDGIPREEILSREDEERLSLDAHDRLFDGDGDLLRWVMEAHRIALAHHFDPYFAIHNSRIEALPHQIVAVYEEMLPRQPLRFLLADDPGAGKTIMAGLLIKELMVRGDVRRCLVVLPSKLAEQWRDELYEKFDLKFDIFSRDMMESSLGNPFEEYARLIVRLDLLIRHERFKKKLEASGEWDLIICDEAHRMSALVSGKKVKKTKRYHIGESLSGLCRHFLLMTATPHNGKEADFQAFMALLDRDRFEGSFRRRMDYGDPSDLMRRMTKDNLFRFDGRPLFPERYAYTVRYPLSSEEKALYLAVTRYVREEMEWVDRLKKKNRKRSNTVGFALQILQRRLASSPAAIYHSLKRRCERLQEVLRLKRDRERLRERILDRVSQDPWEEDEWDTLEEYDQGEIDEIEEEIVAGSTASESRERLSEEIKRLEVLEGQAYRVWRSGENQKWKQLARVFEDSLMVDDQGHRRKLIIFTEAKDTLDYLVEKIEGRLGDSEAVACLHGGIKLEDRKEVIERFMKDKELLVLVATDVAGEGINLQSGHLMVNYDLPWNPNRIEQRFGRIHRIGQREVCHLWNLVAGDTREGRFMGDYWRSWKWRERL